MYSLIIRSPGYPPQKVRLVRPQNTIGRSVRADIAIPDSFASRLHARLQAEESGYILEDLQSANGTYFNGMRVTVPIRLKPGDVIRIGETDLEFTSDTIRIVYRQPLQKPRLEWPDFELRMKFWDAPPAN